MSDDEEKIEDKYEYIKPNATIYVINEIQEDSNYTKLMKVLLTIYFFLIIFWYFLELKFFNKAIIIV